MKNTLGKIAILVAVTGGVVMLFPNDAPQDLAGVKTTEVLKKEKFDTILLTSKIDTENKNGNLTKAELVELKSYAIVQKTKLGKFSEPTYDIEIVETNVIDGGIEVFARAWKNGVQLGFGKDGTIDIERFRIFNPPVLVSDPLGDINKDYTNEITGELVVNRFREDPEEAILQSLTHTISNVGKEGTTIIAETIGNTTDTFYSSTGGDGTIRRGPNTQTTWTAARDTADGEVAAAGNVSDFIFADRETGTNFTVSRQFYPFDTSSIPDTDTISSATFSFYQTNAGSGVRSVGLVQTSQASMSSLALADFDTCGAVNSATEGATRVTATAVQYQDFALNATGLTWIDKTGYTKLGTRLSKDLDNSAPAAREYIAGSFADETGTANDPKLVVVHSGGETTDNGVTILFE